MKQREKNKFNGGFLQNYYEIGKKIVIIVMGYNNASDERVSIWNTY